MSETSKNMQPISILLTMYVTTVCQTISSYLNGKFWARIICSVTSLTTLTCLIEHFKSDPVLFNASIQPTY